MGKMIRLWWCHECEQSDPVVVGEWHSCNPVRLRELRVARAIAGASHVWHGGPDAEYWLLLARAAIEAMPEPSVQRLADETHPR